MNGCIYGHISDSQEAGLRGRVAGEESIKQVDLFWIGM